MGPPELSTAQGTNSSSFGPSATIGKSKKAMIREEEVLLNLLIPVILLMLCFKRTVRSFVEHIVDLLTNSEMLEEEREKAKEIKNRMGGANRETGFGSNVGDGVQGAGEKYSGFGPNSKRKPADSPFGGAYKDPSAYDTMGAYDNYESKGGLFDKIGVKKEEKEKETKKEEPSQKEKKEKEPSNAAPPKKKVLPPPPNFSGASNVPKGPSLDEKAKSASVKEQPKGSVDLLDLDFVGTSSQNSTIGTTAPVSIRQGSNMGNSTNGVASSSGKQEQNKHDEDEDLFDDFQEAKDDDDFFKDFEGSESTAATSTQPNQSGLHQQAQISFAVKQPELITMSPKKESKPVEPVVKPRKKGDLIDDLIDLSDIGAPSQKDSKKPSKDTHASEQSLEASLDSYSPNQDYGLRSTNYHPVPTTFQPMMPSHGYQNYQNMPYGPQMGMNMMGNQPHYPGMAPIYGQGGMMQPAGMHGMLSQYGESAMGMGMMSHGGFQGASQPMGMRPNGWGPMQN